MKKFLGFVILALFGVIGYGVSKYDSDIKSLNEKIENLEKVETNEENKENENVDTENKEDENVDTENKDEENKEEVVESNIIEVDYLPNISVENEFYYNDSKVYEFVNNEYKLVDEVKGTINDFLTNNGVLEIKNNSLYFLKNTYNVISTNSEGVASISDSSYLGIYETMPTNDEINSRKTELGLYQYSPSFFIFENQLYKCFYGITLIDSVEYEILDVVDNGVYEDTSVGSINQFLVNQSYKWIEKIKNLIVPSVDKVYELKTASVDLYCLPKNSTSVDDLIFVETIPYVRDSSLINFDYNLAFSNGLWIKYDNLCYGWGDCEIDYYIGDAYSSVFISDNSEEIKTNVGNKLNDKYDINFFALINDETITQGFYKYVSVDGKLNIIPSYNN